MAGCGEVSGGGNCCLNRKKPGHYAGLLQQHCVFSWVTTPNAFRLTDRGFSSCHQCWGQTLPGMHPVQPRGGNLAAGEPVVIELDPNEIGCGIFWFDPDVFAPAVADGAEFANELVILAVKKGDDGSFGRADKNHARSVDYFLTSHGFELKRLGRSGLFGFDVTERATCQNSFHLWTGRLLMASVAGCNFRIINGTWQR